jgi:hypothetical protein
MDISTSGSKITITGNIKSVADYQTIKTVIDDVVANHEHIAIEIKDSISMTSSIIGYFNKLILKDKIKVSMKIGNGQLMELLEDLNLSSLFQAKKG